MSCEETFGPVAGIAASPTRTRPCAWRTTRRTGCGYFYSQSNARIVARSEALEYGIVGINTGFISTEVAPFGG